MFKWSSKKNGIRAVVKAADDTLHNYSAETRDINVKDTVKSKTELELVSLFKHIQAHFPEFAEVYLGTRWGGYATLPQRARRVQRLRTVVVLI